jgi:hypothetical protein
MEPCGYSGATRGEKSRIRVILYGCGRMGRVLLRYLHESGAQIVGAIDTASDLVGRDAGEVAGLGMVLNIRISDDPEAVFNQCSADICVSAVASTVLEMYPVFEMAARRGVNMISTCDEAFYSWTTSASLTNSLDRLAKAGCCTLTASGYQDVFWGNLITVLAGAAHRIDRIQGMSSYNADEYGVSLAEAHGVGLSIPEFERVMVQRAGLYSTAWNTVEWLVSAFGWTVRRISERLVPQVGAEDVYSQTLQRVIPKGDALGMSAIATVETIQGPVVEFEAVGKVYAPGEVDQVTWTLRGEPAETTLRISQPATVELTCATIVNRLPQIIQAPPGFVTVEKLQPAGYRTYPLHYYL